MQRLLDIPAPNAWEPGPGMARRSGRRAGSSRPAGFADRRSSPEMKIAPNSDIIMTSTPAPGGRARAASTRGSPAFLRRRIDDLAVLRQLQPPLSLAGQQVMLAAGIRLAAPDRRGDVGEGAQIGGFVEIRIDLAWEGLGGRRRRVPAIGLVGRRRGVVGHSGVYPGRCLSVVRPRRPWMPRQPGLSASRTRDMHGLLGRRGCGSGLRAGAWLIRTRTLVARIARAGKASVPGRNP